jgi:hypothetical protein
MNHGAAAPDEATGLLSGQGLGHEHSPSEDDVSHLARKVSPVAVLPIALLAALAMAATAATTIYAYASLLCKDPTHCRDAERNVYAGAVAVATCVANVCAILALGSFEKLSKRNHKAGIATWLICRSLSVAALALGGQHFPSQSTSMAHFLIGSTVHLRSIGIALAGQVFEGLASDNILHFNLNAIYVQAPDKRMVSRLIGASLALYMVGISVSPAISSLLESFQASFLMASVMFAVALLYLLFGVRSRRTGRDQQHQNTTNGVPGMVGAEPRTRRKISVWDFVRISSSPLQFFATRPSSLLPGFSLLLYNAMQSYVFPAIMVYTSVTFGFSGRENGFLISIGHGVSSTYLICTLFVAPCIVRLVRKHTSSKIPPEVPSTEKRSGDAALALFSLLVQGLSLTLFGLATKVWQAYAIISLSALGLATPSFIKSYFVTLFPSTDAPNAVAALAMLETIGSLLAPISLGVLQTMWPGNGVFFIAAIFIGIAAVIFGIGLIMLQVKREDLSRHS